MADGIYPRSFENAMLIGEVPDKVALFVDTYASRPNGGAYQCGAGEEAFLRLVALGNPMRGTLSLRIESCWYDVELGDDGIEWNPEQRVLSIDFLYTPDDPHPTGPHRYAVADDGVATRLPARQ